MQLFRDILVGVDLSSVDPQAGVELTAPNQQALDRAIWLASRTQENLTIFSCIHIYPYVREALQRELEGSRLESEGRKILEGFVARAKIEGVHARSKLVFGVPWEEICLQVQSDEHDLVIIGTRDLGRAGRFLFGSTGMKLLRNCPCPIWVTRPDAHWDHVNVLVPSDFSDVSLEALRLAVNVGQLFDTRIHVLHAFERPVGPPAWYGYVSKQMVEDRTAAQRAEADKKLHEQLARTDYRTLRHGAQVHVVDGPADEAILKAIDDFQIGLVVMGTAARSGLAGLALGNTTERLVSQMRCSLMAVKPAGFRCTITPTPKPGFEL